MKPSKHYLKIVEWSEEDQCYVGTCPTLLRGGVHGKDEAKVYAELCQAVEEAVSLYKKDNKSLPEPTNRAYSGKFVLRVGKDLHQIMAVRAMQSGKSLNSYCQALLQASVSRQLPA